MRIALSIAGSDPSGGAGIQADLKTFHQFGVYGEAVLTLITVQNTREVRSVELLPPALVAEQIDAVLTDIPPLAIKTGALGSAPIIEAVAGQLHESAAPVVVDPVMISKHGSPLLAGDAQQALESVLLPLAHLVTPNLPEAARLARMDSIDDLQQARDAAKRIRDFGSKSVLIKGGHFTDSASDLLFTNDQFFEFPSERIQTPHTHGTGCTYSAAITALLACGHPLEEAVGIAKVYITEAIRSNPGLGSGNGPVNHFAPTAIGSSVQPACE